MGLKIVLTGMVLSAMPVGDYDKRIQILTRERGKITAFARGARRQNSPLLAATNPFSSGQFEVFEGKTAYSLSKADIRNYFRELACDLQAVSYGFYFLEMAAWYTQENMDGTDFLNLLYLTLKALLKPSLENSLVRRIYEMRVLLLSGEYPDVFSCMKCGGREELYYFSIQRHGCLCTGCLKGEHAFPIDESTLYALQYVLTAPLEKLYTFTLSAPVLARLEEIVAGYMRHYSDHRFKSEEMLECAQVPAADPHKWRGRPGCLQQGEIGRNSQK